MLLKAAKTPAEAEKANQAAAEAAKSPLPESDLSDEEPPPTAPEPAPAPKPAGGLCFTDTARCVLATLA